MGKNFGAGENGEVIGILTSHAGDLLIYRSDLFIPLAPGGLGNEFAINVFGGGRIAMLRRGD